MKRSKSSREADSDLYVELQELRDKCSRLEHEAIERSLTEESLRQGEGTFRTLFDEVSDPIFTIYPSGHYGYVNRAFAEGVGKRQEEIIGKTIHDVFGRKEADKRFAVVRSVLKQRKPKVLEVCVPRPEGNRYYITTAKPIFDDETGYVLCISKDITERKQAEARLRESEERLELALAGSGTGLWDVDVQHGKAVYDERWCSILGYRIDEIEMDLNTWERLVHPDDWPGVKAAVDAHLAGDTESYESEHRLRHKDGHWVWTLARGKVVARDSEGRPLRTTGTQLDISRHKRLNVEGTDLLKRIESLIRAMGERPGMGNGAPFELPSPPQLSNRQRQVLELVAKGCTSTEIARRLKITLATAITHRRDLMRRLDLHNIAELTRYAIEHKIVSR
jgi:PAS domain S-box-containing protein